MTFPSRQAAGRQLGEHLRAKGVIADLALGLPRGGVVVAAEVAKSLGCPLDVLVVRKIGHPNFREFAVGALGEDDVVVLDDAVLKRAHVSRRQLEAVLAEEARRLRVYQEEFAHTNRLSREGKNVVLVDDGLATGATLEAAALSARKQGAEHILAAVPVASTEGAARIRRVCDQFEAVLIDPSFQAVGQYYDMFGQTTDEEVRAILGI